MIKDKLQLYIVTYNRKKTFEYTLQKVLNNDVFGACNICILDNASTDGTSELIDQYCEKYSNLTHFRHEINIGGNANVCRAFEMAATCGKEYFWILCDDDEYTFTNIDEIENLMNKNVDAICVERKTGISQKTIYPTVISAATFVPAIIYKTENVTSQVLQNMYLNTYTCYPHIALIIHLANAEKTFAFATRLVTQKINLSFHRGTNDEEYFRLKNLILQVALINSYQMINNKKLRAKCCNDIWAGLLFFKTMLIVCKDSKMHTYNVSDTFWGINLWQKIQFILAYFWVHLHPAKYKYMNIQQKEEWIDYLNKTKEQKYINKLAKKLKNKKIVLYGAGLLTNIIISNYDISKLNIVGICDKRFENTDEKSWNNYPVIKIADIDKNADIILISLKFYNSIRYKLFFKYKLHKKIYSILNTSLFYPIATLKTNSILYIKIMRKLYLSLCKYNNIRKVMRHKYRNTIPLKNQIFTFKDIS